MLTQLNALPANTVEALHIPREQVTLTTHTYLTQFQNALPTVSAIHGHIQNLPAFILNPIQNMTSAAQETLFPVIEFLLTEIPTRGQQILEAINGLQEAQVNTHLTTLSQAAVTTFANLQPAQVQPALVNFCPHLAQSLLALFPNQIAAQAANQAGGMVGIAVNFMPQAMLNATIAPIITAQLQAGVMQLPPYVIAQISQQLAHQTPAALTLLFTNWRQQTLTGLNTIQDFYQRLVTEFGPTPLQGLTQASEALAQRLNAFSERNQPGEAAVAEMNRTLTQNHLLKARRQATGLALEFDRRALPNTLLLKIFSYLAPIPEQAEETSQRETHLLNAYRLAIRKAPKESVAPQKRQCEESANDHEDAPSVKKHKP